MKYLPARDMGVVRSFGQLTGVGLQWSTGMLLCSWKASHGDKWLTLARSSDDLSWLSRLYSSRKRRAAPIIEGIPIFRKPR